MLQAPHAFLVRLPQSLLTALQKSKEGGATVRLAPQEDSGVIKITDQQFTIRNVQLSDTVQIIRHPNKQGGQADEAGFGAGKWPLEVSLQRGE